MAYGICSKYKGNFVGVAFFDNDYYRQRKSTRNLVISSSNLWLEKKYMKGPFSYIIGAKWKGAYKVGRIVKHSIVKREHKVDSLKLYIM